MNLPGSNLGRRASDERLQVEQELNEVKRRVALIKRQAQTLSRKDS